MPLAPDKVKDATELTVGVSPARFEFDGAGGCDPLRVGGIQLGSTELEPIDEQPHPVPADRLDTSVPQELAEVLHRVGPDRHSQDPDFAGGIPFTEA
jgi:hypothetical protein